MLLLFVVMFYVIFPAGMSLFGFSFIFTSGAIGGLLYLRNGFPFGEVVSIILFFVLIIFWSVFCTFANGQSDMFIFEYTKSQMAWVFSAYLIAYLFFKIHPKGGVHLLIYYLLAVITAQGIISVAMDMNPEIRDFFDGLQGISELEKFKRMQTSGHRLLGYGVAFFGAGIVFGLSLIFIVYILFSRKLNLLQQIFIAILYVFLLMVGMLSARTTLVGAFASVALIGLLFFKGGDKARKSQAMTILFLGVVFITIGTTVVYTYFDEFAEWAFEPFLNYQETGEFRTSSSDGLSIMFYWPDNMHDWLIGIGIGSFIASDVGFTRLWLWFGLPGMILFFGYQLMIIKQSFTSNIMLNITLLVTFAYNLALNVKGLSDLNHFWLIFAMYFLYYKYFVYTPYLYRIGRIRENTLRNAVQSPTAYRRI